MVAEHYRALPELEDLTMHLAEAAKIAVVPHGLIRFADGELCYITRRIDRLPDGGKLPMEDMCQFTEHLKNFSLYNTGLGYCLTPAYDLLSTNLVMPEDTEELALTLNGKKRKIQRSDFEKSIIASGVNAKVIDNISKKFRRSIIRWMDLIDASFLPSDFKKQYKRLILKRVLMLR